MKKNLNFLLAALAAMALVFAAGCSDDPDDAGGGYSYTSEYSGTTWTYEGTTPPAASATTITSIALQFASSGNGVGIVVDWYVCGSQHGTNGHSSSATAAEACVGYTATVNATYTALGSRVGILLPQTGGGASSGGNDAVELTFTYDSTTTPTPTLTLAGASESATYTVAADDDSTGCDLFAAAGALTASGTASAFELDGDEQ